MSLENENDGIIKKKILNERLFLVSSTSSNLTSKNEIQIKKSNFNNLFSLINNLTVNNNQENNNTNNTTTTTTTSNNNNNLFQIKENNIQSQLFQRVNELFNDLILKKTIIIETSLNIMSVLRIFTGHQVSNLELLFQNDKQLEELENKAKLWRFPSNEQINHLSTLKLHSDLQLSSTNNQYILDTVWKRSKNQNEHYSIILKEHLLLWEESLQSVCTLYFNSIVPTVYLISSNFRIIFSHDPINSNECTALISSCPRSLYLKMIEYGIEVLTLLNNNNNNKSYHSNNNNSNSNNENILPIQSLSDKILLIKGNLSIRLFIDLLTSHCLSLHSISSYPRIVENLPIILTSQYFLHSTLQINTIDSYVLEPNELQTDPIRTEDNTTKKIQLNGYFTYHSIELLCYLLTKLGNQKSFKNVSSIFSTNNSLNNNISVNLSSTVEIDPRITSLIKQRQENKLIDSNNMNNINNSTLLNFNRFDEQLLSTSSTLLNPFQITKSDPIETTITTHPIHLNEITSEDDSILKSDNSNDSIKKRENYTYFNIKLHSSQLDQFCSYLQNFHQDYLQDSLKSREEQFKNGYVLTNIHWNEFNTLKKYRIEIKNLLPCKIENIKYKRNKNTEEEIIMIE